MGFTVMIKKISFLFLLISAAFLSISSAGRVYKSIVSKDVSTNEDMDKWEPLIRHDEMGHIHERLLKVKTNDYGRYDPSPSFVKPPFKLIPN